MPRLGKPTGKLSSRSDESGQDSSRTDLSASSSFDSADLENDNGLGFAEDYDFSKHEQNKQLLEMFLSKEGRFALDPCDRLSTEIIGLHNQGATCYLNSLLQTLFYTRAFREKVYDWTPTPDDVSDPEKCIPLQLQQLFARLQLAEEAAVSTTALTKSFGWSDADAFEQQDVQELARVLFDSLEQFKDGKSFVNSFKGSLVDYITCLQCSHRRARREEFQDLSLVVQDVVNVRDALHTFVEVERLDGDNQYFCEHCNAKADAVKGHRLVTLPSTLVLHLKRFDFDWETGRRNKIDDTVEIPLHLDVAHLVGLDNYKQTTECSERNSDDENPGASNVEDSISDSLDEDLMACQNIRQDPAQSNIGLDDDNEDASPTQYKLSAIIVHQGSANSGHYYAIVRTGESIWHEFNDTTVTELDEEQVMRMCHKGGCLAEGGAYMLFYTSASQADRYAKSLIPKEDLIEWVQERNEYRSFLRQVRTMDRQLVRIRVVAGPALNSQHELFPSMPESTTITVHSRKATPADVKNLAYRQLVPHAVKENIPLIRCRLRRVRENMNRIGSAIDVSEDRSLETLGFVGQATLLLEFCPPWLESSSWHAEVSREAQEDVVQVCLFAWNEAVCEPLPLRASWTGSTVDATDSAFNFQTSFLPVILPHAASIREARQFIACKLGIPTNELELLRANSILSQRHRDVKDSATIEVLKDVNEFSISELFRHGDGILITRSTVLDANALVEAYTEAMSFMEITFNDPRLNARGEPVQYNHSIRIQRDLSLLEVKERLLRALEDKEELDIDAFHIRGSAKGPQIKDTSVTLEAAGFCDHSVIHLGKGKPIPPGSVLMRVFKRDSTEVAFRVFVPERAFVQDVRSAISQELGLESSENLQLFERSPRGDEGEELNDGRPIRRLVDGKGVFFEYDEHALVYKTGEANVAQSQSATSSNDHGKSKDFPSSQMRELASHEAGQGIVFPEAEKVNLDEDTKFSSSRRNAQSGPAVIQGIDEAEVNDSDSLVDGNTTNTALCKVKPNQQSTWTIDSDGIENYNERCRELSQSGSKATLQRVPSLDLASLPPRKERISYQEEFLAQKEDWSESWRAELDAELAGREDDASDAEANISQDSPYAPPAGTPHSANGEDLEKAAGVTHAIEEPFPCGAKVLAKAAHWKRFFPGTIFSYSSSLDLYTIDFDDGDRLEEVPRERIRLQSVLQKSASSNSNKQRPRVITNDAQKENAPPAVSSNTTVPSPEETAEKEDHLEETKDKCTPSSHISEPLDTDNLCPEDKKSRRKEKIATRDFRLQLLHMGGDEQVQPSENHTASAASNTESHHDSGNNVPLQSKNTLLDTSGAAPRGKPARAQSSPSRSRVRTYLSDGHSRKNRTQSSKLVRPKALEPLASRPQATIPRDPLEVAPKSRIPRLASLQSSTSKGHSTPTSVASPRSSSTANSFKHSARVLRDNRQEQDTTVSRRRSHIPERRSSALGPSLPPL